MLAVGDHLGVREEALVEELGDRLLVHAHADEDELTRRGEVGEVGRWGGEEVGDCQLGRRRWLTCRTSPNRAGMWQTSGARSRACPRVMSLLRVAYLLPVVAIVAVEILVD